MEATQPDDAALVRLRGPAPGHYAPHFRDPVSFRGLVEPSRIYVALPNWVGDVVMCTPALRALRQRFPRAEIVAQAKGHLGELVVDSGLIDEFFPSPKRGAANAWRAARVLRARGFDWAVLMAESERAALLPALAGIPVRAGLFHTWARKRLLTHGIPRVRSTAGALARFSMIERYLMVTRALGAPDQGAKLALTVTESQLQRIEARLQGAGLDAEAPLLSLVIGAAAGSAKAWPAASFAEAADRLHQRFGWHPVIAPGPGEEALAAEVAKRARCRVVVLTDPTVSLGGLAALLARSAFVLTNDTGPRSMAVALGKPLAVPVGPTDRAFTDHHLEGQAVLTADVACRPCHLDRCPIDHRCMTRITPAIVVDAASRLLDGCA